MKKTIQFLSIILLIGLLLYTEPHKAIQSYFEEDPRKNLVVTENVEQYYNLHPEIEVLTINYSNAYPPPFVNDQEGIDYFLDEYVRIIRSFPKNAYSFEEIELLNEVFPDLKTLQKAHQRSTIRDEYDLPGFNKTFQEAIDLISTGYETDFEDGYVETIIESIQMLNELNE